jgi:ketosteroid isomerase-like protein
MKKLLLILPLVILLFFTFGCQQGEEAAEEPAVDVEADIAAIKTLNDEWLALYNSGDFDKLVSIFYAEKAVQMPPNEPILEGKEAILLGLIKSREESEEHCESSVTEDVLVYGDLAVARGTDTGTTTPKVGGEPIKYNIKWVIAYERQSDGTWKCVYEIWNDNNPLPPPLPEKE